MTSGIHRFLKHGIGQLFEELSVESGTEIMYSSANLDRCASMIEEYMGLDQLVQETDDEFSDFRMQVDSSE